MRKGLLLAAALLLWGVAGCTPWWLVDEPDQLTLQMVVDVKHDAGKLPDSPEKATLVNRLNALEKALLGGQAPETTRLVSTNRWYELFGPAECEVSYFTSFADFDEDGTPDGLMVRVRLKDAFGDPIKALGAFRIETFTFVGYSTDERGTQLSNWYVSIYTAQDIRKYWDNIDRSFRFPLKFADAVEEDRLVVQATFYLPDGTGRKLFGHRLVKLR